MNDVKSYFCAIPAVSRGDGIWPDDELPYLVGTNAQALQSAAVTLACAYECLWALVEAGVVGEDVRIFAVTPRSANGSMARVTASEVRGDAFALAAKVAILSVVRGEWTGKEVYHVERA